MIIPAFILRLFEVRVYSPGSDIPHVYNFLTGRVKTPPRTRPGLDRGRTDMDERQVMRMLREHEQQITAMEKEVKRLKYLLKEAVLP